MTRCKMSPERRETYVERRQESKARTHERRLDRIRKAYSQGRV